MLCVHWVQKPSATFSVNQTFTYISDTKWPFSVTDNKCERRTTLAEILESTVHWHKSPSSNIHRLSNSPLGTLHMNARRLLLNRLSASVLFFFFQTLRKDPFGVFTGVIQLVALASSHFSEPQSAAPSWLLFWMEVHCLCTKFNASARYQCLRLYTWNWPIYRNTFYVFCIHVPNPPWYEAHVLMYELF